MRPLRALLVVSTPVIGAILAMPSCGLLATFDRTQVTEDAGKVELVPPLDAGARDSRLASLSLDVAPLTPGFTPDRQSYAARYRMASAYATFDTKTVGVTPVALDPFADIDVLGADAQGKSGQVALVPLASSRQEIGVSVLASGSTDSRYYRVDLEVDVSDFLKASNTRANARFGSALAISGDTLVVGARDESSNASGVNGNQSDASQPGAGAVYVFVRSGTTWRQEAYLKGGALGPREAFGTSVAISGDTIAVGAPGELTNAGSVRVFHRTSGVWSVQAVVHASNLRSDDPSTYGDGARFGTSVALAGDDLVVGAPNEPSASFGVGGDPSSVAAPLAGAVYTFLRAGTVWTQQAYVKSSHTAPGSRFGGAVAYAANTLAIGSEIGVSGARGGAVYLYDKNGASWTYRTFVEASRPDPDALFGGAIALSPNGATLAVGAERESSAAIGIDGDHTNTSAPSAGAAYVFVRNGTAWRQDAYIKPSNTRAEQQFGHAVALSSTALVVGAWGESSNGVGFNGNQSGTQTQSAGAAYVFRRAGSWAQTRYVKASNPANVAFFGDAVAVTDAWLAIGALGEKSSATGVDGNELDKSLSFAGAVYLY